MLLGACAGPAARAPARSAGQLAGSPTSPSTINGRARRLPEPGSAQHHRRRQSGAAVCAPPAALPSESLPETRKDQEQRLAALEVQARQCELLLDQAEAAAAAAAAPKAAKAAADKALQPWVYAAAGAGAKAAKQVKGLRTEADEIVESLSKALCGTEVLLSLEVQLGLESELTCVDSLADSRAALQLMAAEARMAGGVSELTHLRLTITAVLAAAVQQAPLVSSSGTVAPFLRMRLSDVAVAAAAGAVVLKEMRVNSGQGGPDCAAELAAAEAKAAAAADMLGQLALCLAASAGVEWAAEE
ncbi:hypothetical protein COHA_001014 [Chlorella ohadii]|uniref:Uncharacterized protein n=1 Tax=Chlorella ohadii TaxID=2649997 RepID=A0AAD5H5W6_9CHLO|nr:hypothetical protein COHA_001014 [Chlorella ohadii]